MICLYCDIVDRNGDGILTEEEFIALPPGEVEAEFKEADTKWQEERRKEFRENIDMDHDGRTSLKELQVGGAVTSGARWVGRLPVGPSGWGGYQWGQVGGAVTSGARWVGW